jgi:hypothetical protein
VTGLGFAGALYAADRLALLPALALHPHSAADPRPTGGVTPR